ncbi:hypothetical protein Hanom_Chr12g01119451 [Helianthus anomalus]
MADRKLEEDGVSATSKELIADCDPSKRPKRNKYAFACAMLASMTSVLLGYGNLLPHFLVYIFLFSNHNISCKNTNQHD